MLSKNQWQYKTSIPKNALYNFNITVILIQHLIAFNGAVGRYMMHGRLECRRIFYRISIDHHRID